MLVAAGAAAAVFFFSQKATAAPGGPPPTPTPGAPPNTGLMGLSYLGQTGLPRGMRNNNPGNIKRSGSAWKGKIPHSQSTDQIFEQFSAFAYGTRAMIKLLQNYMAAGHDTLEAIVNRYAPAADNNVPAAYINWVFTRTGFVPTQRLTPDKETLRRLVRNMAHYENGRDVVTNEMFDLAYSIL